MMYLTRWPSIEQAGGEQLLEVPRVGLGGGLLGLAGAVGGGRGGVLVERSTNSGDSMAVAGVSERELG